MHVYLATQMTKGMVKMTNILLQHSIRIKMVYGGMTYMTMDKLSDEG